MSEPLALEPRLRRAVGLAWMERSPQSCPFKRSCKLELGDKNGGLSLLVVAELGIVVDDDCSGGLDSKVLAILVECISRATSRISIGWMMSNR